MLLSWRKNFISLGIQRNRPFVGNLMPRNKYDVDAVQTKVGNRIRSIRLTLGMSQSELAKEYGSTTNCHSRYENGYVVMGIDKFLAIAHALGVTPNDLAPPFDAENSISDQYSQLSQENQKAVKDVISKLLNSQKNKNSTDL